MDSLAGSQVSIEVALATPSAQQVRSLLVARGTTVAEAIEQSGIAAEFSDLDLGKLAVGIWGEVCDRNRPVSDGDRVELYRPLEMDPREARRALAASGKTM